MQTPANDEAMPRCQRDVSGAGSRYRIGTMHLGSESQEDPGVSPAESSPQQVKNRLAGDPGSARLAQFAHFIPAPLLFPPNRYGAFPELFS